MKLDEITKDTVIEELIEEIPDSSTFFLRFGIRCFTCSGALWGTIEDVLRNKNIDDIEGTVSGLKEYLSAKKR